MRWLRAVCCVIREGLTLTNESSFPRFSLSRLNHLHVLKECRQEVERAAHGVSGAVDRLRGKFKRGKAGMQRLKRFTILFSNDCLKKKKKSDTSSLCEIKTYRRLISLITHRLRSLITVVLFFRISFHLSCICTRTFYSDGRAGYVSQDHMLKVVQMSSRKTRNISDPYHSCQFE